MTDMTKLREVVREALRDAAEGVPGTVLAASIRQQVPDFRPSEYGARNLKDFIAANVPDVVIVGRAGADVVYGMDVVAHGVPSATGAHRVPAAWAAWATPSSGFVLNVAQDGRVAVSMSGSAGPHSFEPLSVHRHRAIAKEFLEKAAPDLPQSNVERLRSAIADTSNAWWGPWMAAARAHPATNTHWLRFRLQRLKELLMEDIEALPLEPSARARAFNEVVGTRARGRPPTPSPIPSIAASADADTLRSVISSALSVLDEHELRQIALPVGVVFDMLRERWASARK